MGEETRKLERVGRKDDGRRRGKRPVFEQTMEDFARLCKEASRYLGRKQVESKRRRNSSAHIKQEDAGT